MQTLAITQTDGSLMCHLGIPSVHISTHTATAPRSDGVRIHLPLLAITYDEHNATRMEALIESMQRCTARSYVFIWDLEQEKAWVSVVFSLIHPTDTMLMAALGDSPWSTELHFEQLYTTASDQLPRADVEKIVGQFRRSSVLAIGIQRELSEATWLGTVTTNNVLIGAPDVFAAGSTDRF